MSANPTAFIRASLLLEAVPALPDVSIYAAHSGSRLSRLLTDDGGPPYWAFPWAGGLALAQHFLAHPEHVAGRRMLDLGAGSGLVGIVAARLGAVVCAAEIDPIGRAAIELNAAANGVSIALVDIDLAGAPPVAVDLVAAGDDFYNPAVAAAMLPFLLRCEAASIDVLIGDPGRRDLPVGRLERVASYAVGDVGDARNSAERLGYVYRLK